MKMVPNQMSETPLKSQYPADPRQHSTPKPGIGLELGSKTVQLYLVRMVCPGDAASAEPAAEPEPYTFKPRAA
jgi:hypothetical protein